MLPPSPRRWTLTLLVIALHLLLLAGLRAGLLQRPALLPPEARRITVSLLPERRPPVHPGAPAPAAPPQRARPPIQSRPFAPATPATPPQAVPVPSQAAELPPSLALPSEASASAPRERLLDSAATRSALRQAAREPLGAERHQMAQGQETGVSASERLGRRMQQAGHGDCGKGQFAGSGMGLLSTPFYLLAEATGKCAKGSPPPSGPPPDEPSGRKGAHPSMPGH